MYSYETKDDFKLVPINLMIKEQLFKEKVNRPKHNLNPAEILGFNRKINLEFPQTNN